MAEKRLCRQVLECRLALPDSIWPWPWHNLCQYKISSWDTSINISLESFYCVNCWNWHSECPIKRLREPQGTILLIINDTPKLANGMRKRLLRRRLPVEWHLIAANHIELWSPVGIKPSRVSGEWVALKLRFSDGFLRISRGGNPRFGTLNFRRPHSGPNEWFLPHLPLSHFPHGELAWATRFEWERSSLTATSINQSLQPRRRGVKSKPMAMEKTGTFILTDT